MAGACAGGIKVEETNGDSIEPIPTLPNDRPLLPEVLPVAPSIDDEQEDEQEPAETAPVAPQTQSRLHRFALSLIIRLPREPRMPDEDEGFDSGLTAPKNVSSIVRTLKDTQRRFAPDLGDALTRCFQRCEPQASSSPSNCRQGYRCVPMPRANAPPVIQACMRPLGLAHRRQPLQRQTWHGAKHRMFPPQSELW